MAYHLSISAFDGPLDLLLYLVSCAQIDIRDIFMSEITDQFIEYMAYTPELDMLNASEFIAMAARLMEIKSRRLLPNAKEDEELQQQEDELMRQLDEYMRIKQAVNYLQEKGTEAANLFYRLPIEVTDGEIQINNASVQLLSEAFARVFARLHREEEQEVEAEIERETFTVQQQISHIQELLRRHKRLSFHSLFSGSVTRQQLVTAFLALLELVRMNRIQVEQTGLYQDITICPVLAGKKGIADGTT